MKLNLFRKILGIVLTSIVLAVAVVGGTSLLMSQKMADTLSNHTLRMKLSGDVRSAQDALAANFGQVRLADGELVDGNGSKIAGSFDFVDTLSNKLGIVATIFAKDGNDYKRITTNIKKDDGSRAVGTFLGKGSAAYQPINSGQLYLGSANILGKPYLTAYDPIFDANGKPIGILFIGIARSDIDAIIADFRSVFQYWLGGITLVVLIVGSVIAFIFARSLAGAVGFMTTYMIRFANGNIRIDDTDRSSLEEMTKRRDEIGAAATAFGDLTVYMSEKSQAAQRMADGDFSVAIELASEQDDFGQAFKTMTEKLSATLSQVRE